MVWTRSQLENFSKEELIDELISVEDIKDIKDLLNYLISEVVSMIFWDGMKFLIQN